MKRYVVLIVIVSAVLITAFNAFGQDKETSTQKIQKQMREQQAQMREKSRNMSDEERAKLREQTRERNSSQPISRRRDDQMKSIKAIEAQVIKLKAAVEAGTTDDINRLPELSREEQTKLLDKMKAATRERQTAIQAIEKELAKLKGPNRRPTESEAQLSELRAIHKLAVKEKATQTADRLDKLIMGIQRGSAGREREPREGNQRLRSERPARQEKTE